MLKKSNNRRSALIAAFSTLAVLVGWTLPVLGQVPFVCDNQAFITQDLAPDVKETYLFVVDESVWPHEFSDPIPLTSSTGGELAINNLGFNNKDGFLYGWRRDPQSREIVRIDADGTVTGLGFAGLPDEPFMAGDIAPDGSKMYFASASHISGGDVELYTVPLPVGSGPTTFGVCWGDGTPASLDDRTQNVADWAVSPLDGLLYGADKEGDLVILDPITYERKDLAIGLPGEEGYGAAWFNAAGRLFLYRNRTAVVELGEVFEVDVAVPGKPSIVGSYMASSSKRNDGATCIRGSDLGDRLGALSTHPKFRRSYPSLRYAGRFAGDPPGALPRGERHLIDGAASCGWNPDKPPADDEPQPFGRYSSLNVDPIDNCTFWFTGEYCVGPDGTWSTRIGRFQFPFCGSSC